MKTTITQEIINSAKQGNEDSISQIMESVKFTFLSVVESNKNGFAHKYEIEDFKQQFPTIVWDAIQLYNHEKGCIFNTFFHNHVFWIIGKQKRKVALGQFESPISGICETEEAAEYLLNNMESETVSPGLSIDLDFIKNNDFNLTEHESFLIEKIFEGSNMKEAIDEFESVYGKSRQWGYICRDSAINKIKKYATK